MLFNHIPKLFNRIINTKAFTWREQYNLIFHTLSAFYLIEMLMYLKLDVLNYFFFKAREI